MFVYLNYISQLQARYDLITVPDPSLDLDKSQKTIILSDNIQSMMSHCVKIHGIEQVSLLAHSPRLEHFSSQYIAC